MPIKRRLMLTANASYYFTFAATRIALDAHLQEVER